MHSTSPEGTPDTALFRAARDLLLAHRTDAATARERFTWPEVSDQFNWALDWFDVIAQGNDATALWIVEDDEREAKYTFDGLRRRSNQVGNWLLELGVAPGDAVLLMLANRVELWESMLAVLKIGAVVMPTATVLAPHDLDDRVRRGGAKWVITDAGDAAKFDGIAGDFGVITVPGANEAAAPGEGARPRLDYAAAGSASDAPIARRAGGDEPALAYFTSGTTSKPKIVIHSHRSYPVGHLSTMFWIGVQPGETHMVVSSPGWAKHAWSSFFGPWNAEATIYVDNYARFDPEQLLRHLDRADVNTFCAPPTVWRMLIKHGRTEKPRGLHEAISAGEPLNPEVIDRIRDWWGLEIRDGYGQTEMTAAVGNAPGDIVKAGSMGRALPGLEIVLVDQATGERLPNDAVGVEGEVCIDLAGGVPVSIMTGYAGSDAATAERRAGGVFHTGDVAERDDDGMLTFVGRTDDIFKSSDFKVSPFEVESALITHEAVAEAAVVGAPDDTRQFITKVYVQLASGFEPGPAVALAILRHARETLPPYLCARRVEFAELPKTVSGKIRRVDLRNREREFAERGERIEGEYRDLDFPQLKG
jgi:acetyl-CoA synthetase